ncbi:MAG: serine hydrolase [Chloroflexi bacterium]|nr:serine hydrolase [Chloroflexota bacterium]
MSSAARIVLVAVLVIAGLPTTGSVAQADTAALARSLGELVASFEGKAGILVVDPLTPQPLYATNADTEVITASLYKVAVMLHAEALVEAGTLAYRDRITIQDDDITEDGSFFEAGTTLTIDQALEAMITYSDNGAALAFWHLFGGPAINATLQANRIERLRIAETSAEDSVATPRAVAELFLAMARRQLVSAAASERMLERLQRQRINDRLPSFLPAGAAVAHKTGNLLGLIHDAGIVFTPRGPKVVVAMTWDTWEEPANQLIASVGSAVYSAVLDLPTNARYAVNKVYPADVGATEVVTFRLTNAGVRPWTARGPQAVNVVYDIRDASGKLLGLSAAPHPTQLGANPGQSFEVSLPVKVPAQLGDHTLRIGLADANGLALGPLGVATVTTTLRVHPVYLMTTVMKLSTRMHMGEATMVQVAQFPTAAGRGKACTLTLGYRFLENASGRIVGEGSSPLGEMSAEREGGVYFTSIVAPRSSGGYRLELVVREGEVQVSPITTMGVGIAGPRTYGGNETRALPRVIAPRLSTPIRSVTP